ncbi:carboxypeptidase regulatory-like domain-containing protein [Myxococcus landrumensis]|uniref:Carboxypeptidase regulatory-like domain-containing protein n=1 Tax=Myxococcus landrumensis TaxID=2813577 RepID=A0ABX7N2I9_9BACT|nr:carboxypeptidase regulatory-like domain-containing protein [Myxococcus landrumus]QSQ11611.1 carboxypeptidase regulatory-like domain-containing protein [Myxococcus landrumus]
MKHRLLLASCVLLGLTSSGCGSDDSAPDPGYRTEDSEPVDVDNLSIRVSGKALMLPEAARWLASTGKSAPILSGLTVTLEEPLRVAVNDLDATFGTSTLDEAGAFGVAGISVRDVNVGLAVGMSGPGLARTSTIIYDSAFTGSRPRTNLIETRAYALPESFHDALSTALGESRLLGLTENRARNLREAGFALGRVVDENGRPRAGVRVVPNRTDLAERIFYPSSDLSGVNQEGTSEEGLFVYVHTGLAVESFHVSEEGEENAVPRNVVTAPGWGLMLTLYPGLHPPIE